MFFTQYYLDCLSQASYLVGDESSGLAVVVDPRRDVADYLADALAAAGWRDARFTPATLRHDRGQALAGLFVIASAS